MFVPQGSEDSAGLGIRVYLSSARHRESGSKGECRDPGRPENINSRRWNWYAANGEYVEYVVAPYVTQKERNLHARGYRTMVSPNTKDNNYLENRTESRNWGSDIHIVTHTNGVDGCNQPVEYFVSLWEDNADNRDDKNLALALTEHVGGPPPGPRYTQQRTNLAELETDRRWGDAYVEIAFHDNQNSQTWIRNRSEFQAWRYGLAVDEYLNYPS